MNFLVMGISGLNKNFLVEQSYLGRNPLSIIKDICNDKLFTV
jgi:hypothetical protein